MSEQEPSKFSELPQRATLAGKKGGSKEVPEPVSEQMGNALTVAFRHSIAQKDVYMTEEIVDYALEQGLSPNAVTLILISALGEEYGKNI